MEKHLRDRSYYENIYENFMIEACMRSRDTVKNRECKNDLEKKATHMVGEMMIFEIKYQYYKEREERIREMMSKDKQQDDFLESCKPFLNKHCRSCNGILKHLDNLGCISIGNGKDTALFLYKCKECGERQGIYNNGVYHEKKSHKCKKCNDILSLDSNMDGDILTEKFNCSSCGNNYTEVTDFGTSTSLIEEIIITKKDREKYGYSQKESDQLIQWHANLESLSEMSDRLKEKDKKKDLYEQVKKLEHLNIVGIKKKVISLIEKTPFSDFSIDKNKQVKGGLEIEFTIFYEGDIGDKSTLAFKKLLKEPLAKTNWRLRESSLSEKMGAINGKMVGYDDEDVLVKLANKIIN